MPPKPRLLQQLSDLAMPGCCRARASAIHRGSNARSARAMMASSASSPRGPGEQREPRARRRATRAPDRRPQRKVGSRRSCRIARPGTASNQEPNRKVTFGNASARALSRATPNAPGETSTPRPHAPAAARRRWRAPRRRCPVPRSRTARSSSFGKCSKAARPAAPFHGAAPARRA